ncbi:dnaJ, partial [Symbiodinium pilosum]
LGLIARHCRSRQPWDVLGIPESAGKDEIKLAYRRLALKYHPDVDKSEMATARFQEIQVAYKKMLSGSRSPGAEPRARWRQAAAQRREPTTAKKAASPGRSWSKGAGANGAQPMDTFRISDALDGLLPSRETIAYAMIFLILAPYAAGLVYGLGSLLSKVFPG